MLIKKIPKTKTPHSLGKCNVHRGQIHRSDDGVLGSSSRACYDREDLGSGVFKDHRVPYSQATVLGLADTVTLSVATDESVLAPSQGTTKQKASWCSACNSVFIRY